MFTLRCLFCAHENRAGAKFCEDCGSALGLRLCEQCQAINDRIAQSCHQCGSKFVPWSSEEEGTAFNIEVLQHEVAKENGGIAERLAELSARKYGAPKPNVPSRLTWTRSIEETITRTAAFAPPQDQPSPTVAATLLGSESSPMQPDSKARVARGLLFTLVFAALLGVGYYLYRLPLQTSVRPIANAENPSTAAEREVGGAPPSSQNVSGGPIDASPADAAVSVPAASATEQSSNNTERTVTAPVAPVPAAAVTPPSVTRQETVRPASVPRPPRETRAYVPQPNIGRCTEEIAALGLCSPGARREGS